MTRAPIVVAAMRDNFSWFRSFAKLPNFLNTVQFFLQQPPKFSAQKHQAITYELQEVKQDEVTQKDELDIRKIDKVIPSAPNVG